MNRLIAGVCLVALALSACGSKNGDVLTEDAIKASQSAPEFPDAQPDNEPEPAPPPAAINGLGPEIGNEGTENEMVPAPPPEMAAIPPAFRGHWGMTPEDCSGPNGETHVEIGPDRLTFYEPIGRLRQVLGNYPERFIGVFDYSGEGLRWTERNQLVLTGSSNTLIIISKEGRDTYRRCL